MKRKMGIRILSAILALVCVLNTADVVFPSANAEGEQYVPVDWQVYGSASERDATTYANSLTFEELMTRTIDPRDNITFISTSLDAKFEMKDSYNQLGSDDSPFVGKIRFAVIGATVFEGTKALFKNLGTNVRFETTDEVPQKKALEFTRTSAKLIDSPLLAEKVTAVSNGEGGYYEADWEIICNSEKDDGKTDGVYAGVIGELGENAVVTLSFTDKSHKTKVESNNNVGILCGVMRENSKLKVASLTKTEGAFEVVSKSGAAGGLVGLMLNGAKLELLNGYDDITGTIVKIDGGISLEQPTPPSPSLGASISGPASLIAFRPDDLDVAGEASEEPAEETSEELTAKQTADQSKEATEEPIEKLTDVSAEEPSEEPTDGSAEETTSEPSEELSEEPEEEAIGEHGEGEDKPPAIEEEKEEENKGENEEENTEEPAPEEENDEGGEAISSEGEEPAEQGEKEEENTEEPASDDVNNEGGKAIPSEGEEPVEKSENEEENTEEPATVGNGAKGALTLVPPILKMVAPENLTLSPDVTGFVGGLVGYGIDAEIVVPNGKTVTIDSTSMTGVTTGGGAGGVFGYYKRTATDDDDIAPNQYDLSKYTLLPTITAGKYCGGVFGMLETCRDYIITQGPTKYSDTAQEVSPSFSGGTNRGGVIGLFKTSSLANTLELTEIKTKIRSGGDGGLVARVDEYPAYIKVYKAAAKTTGTVSGGIVGNLGEAGSFLDVSNEVKIVSSTFTGGIIYEMNAGVLRLAGVTTVTASTTSGQIVSKRENGLVYALGDGNTGTTSSGWKLVRGGTRYGDIGDWGEVVRSGALGEHGDDSSDGIVLKYDSSAHTVTIQSAVTSMETVTDFARTALNIQLNITDQPADGALQFTSGNENKSTTLLASKLLTISGTNTNIKLSGTGLTGFTRDDGSQIFEGTLNGKNNTITLATGEGYGVDTSNNAVSVNYNTTGGNGEIFAHKNSGLFGKTGANASISNLTVSGVINVVASGDTAYNAGWKIGGIAAEVTEPLTLNTVTADEAVNFKAANTDGKELFLYAGGAVGLSTAGGSVTDTSSVFKAEITDKTDANRSENVYCGGAVAAAYGGGQTFGFTSTTVAGSYTKENNGAQSRFGGLVGTISTSATVTANNVTFGELTINAKTSAETGRGNNGIGGVLGYSWENTTATVTGLKVGTDDLTHGPSLTATANANIGGLVYMGSGKWTINSVKVNKMTVNQRTGSTFGFTVNDAIHDITNIGHTKTESALYLIVNNKNVGGASYTYDIDGLSFTGSDFDVFDEVAAYSRRDGTVIEDMKQAIVTLELDAAVKMSGDACNTYQNQTTYGKTASSNSKNFNPNTRYYYNVAEIHDHPSDPSSADAYNAERLMLWSLHKYAHGTISDFTTDPLNNTIGGTSGSEIDYNMCGYSYYPVSLYGEELTVQYCTIKFYNEEIENGEKVVSGSGNTDEFCRSTRRQADGYKSQHYLMHCGLLDDFRGNYDSVNKTEDTATLNVNTVTLSGNSGKVSDNSGFLVRGTLGGDQSKTTLNLTGLELDGAFNAGTDTETEGNPTLMGYGALVINAIGSNTTANLTTVKTKADSYNTLLAKVGDNPLKYAATSLIGHVGSESAYGIDLHLSNIVLDARETEDVITDTGIKEELKTAYGTPRSIFKDATLMLSFQYDRKSADSEYNYNELEDYPTDGSSPKHQVTYGAEVYNSLEYAGKENKYYTYAEQAIGDRKYTTPLNDNNPYNFSSGFLRYVKQAKEGKYHELKVNVMVEYSVEGCGRYDDPYHDFGGEFLKTVAKIINGEDLDNTYKITLPDALAESEANPLTQPTQPVDPAHTSAYHSEYTYNSSSDKFENGDKKIDRDDVRKYLAGAYYNVTETVTLDKDFAGLGIDKNTTNNNGYLSPYAFRGVIYGNNTEIVNKSKNPLIANANGAVVKDITIDVQLETGEVDSIITVDSTATADFAYKFSEATVYGYGAVIGQVMGGDNFIDGVSVEFNKTIHFGSGTHTRLMAVGGYVGVVLNGSLVFRNMGLGVEKSGLDLATKCVAGDTETPIAESGYLYVNPIVGRVIAGHVFSEVPSGGTAADYKLVNGTKNYDIPVLDPNEESKLTVNGTTITVPNGQALWVLAAIVNSGAGAATGVSGAYSDFSGTAWQGWRNYCVARDGSSDYYDAEVGEADGKTPYIVKAYTNPVGTSYNARTLGAASTGWTVNITGDCVVPEGFRGIGSFYTSSSNYMIIKEFNGRENEIALSIKYNEYGYNPSENATFSKENYPAVEEANGLGLFNRLKLSSGGTDEKACSVHDFSLTANISYDIYNISDGEKVNYWWRNLTEETYSSSLNLYLAEYASDSSKADTQNKNVLTVGGFAGVIKATSRFFDIDLKSTSIEAPLYAGGLIGYSSGWDIYITDVESSENISVSAGIQAGGLIGQINNGSNSSQSKVLSIVGSNAASKTELKIGEIGTKGLLGARGANFNKVSAGGLIGGVKTAVITIKNYLIQDAIIKTKNNQNDDLNAGGLVGIAHNSQSNGIISNIDLIRISPKASFAAGIAGTVTGTIPVLDGISIIGKADKNSIFGYRLAGGLFSKVSGAVSASNIIIRNYSITSQTMKSNNDKGSAGGLAGFIDASNYKFDIKNVSIENCEIAVLTATEPDDNGKTVDGGNSNTYIVGSGGIVGKINNSSGINGYNILISNTDISVFGGTNKTGSIAGNNNSKVIKLVGVSIQNTTPVKKVGNIEDTLSPYGSGGYVVFADYNGICTTNDKNEDWLTLGDYDINNDVATTEAFVVNDLSSDHSNDYVELKYNGTIVAVKYEKYATGYSTDLHARHNKGDLYNSVDLMWLRRYNPDTDEGAMRYNLYRDPIKLKNKWWPAIASEGSYETGDYVRIKVPENVPIQAIDTSNNQAGWYILSDTGNVKMNLDANKQQNDITAVVDNANGLYVIAENDALDFVTAKLNNVDTKFRLYQDGNAGDKYTLIVSNSYSHVLSGQNNNDRELIEYTFDGENITRDGVTYRKYNQYTDSFADVVKYRLIETSPMGSAPYVTTNPEGVLAKLHLMSDGVGYEQSGRVYTTVAEQILSDMADSTSDKYDYYKLARENITRSDYDGKFSTFGAEMAESGVTYGGPDFPILVLETNNSDPNTYINNYIKLLSNTDYNYANTDKTAIYELEIYKVKLNADGSFSAASTSDRSIEIVPFLTNMEESYFFVSDANVDNDDTTFTVIDVKYKNPSNPAEIAYHLYVPVLVKKVLKFTVDVRLRAGTSYDASSGGYTATDRLVCENDNTPITAHIEYGYDAGESSWKSSINAGIDFTENYNKTLRMVKGSGYKDLPNDTPLCLVDVQTGQHYYSTFGAAFAPASEGSLEGELDFSKFNTEIDGSGTDFKPISLSELLEVTAKAATDADVTKFVECPDTEATVRAKVGVDYKWLRPYNSATDGEVTKYEIEGVTPATEKYFLTYYTGDINGVVDYTLSEPNSLDRGNLMPAVHDTGGGDGAVLGRQSTMYEGDIYTLSNFTMKTTSTGQNPDVGFYVLNKLQNTITVDMTVTVSMVPSMFSNLKYYKLPIYQNFMINMLRTDAGGSITGITGAPKIVSATYSVDGVSKGSYEEPSSTGAVEKSFAEFITKDMLDFTTSGSSSHIVHAVVTLSYDNEDAISAQFPLLPNDYATSSHGTVVNVRSSIGSTQERTTYSNSFNTKTDENNNRYYSGVTIKKARLSYNPVTQIENGDMAQLGVNPWDNEDMTTAKIETIGVFNFADVKTEAEGWDYAQITWSFKKKQNGYQDADISDLMTSLEICGTEYYSASLDNAITVTVPKTTFAGSGWLSDSEDEIEIPIDFVVKTGKTGAAGGFEDSEFRYANYQVILNVKLLRSSAVCVELSSGTDYPHIIYTNARVYPEFFSTAGS